MVKQVIMLDGGSSSSSPPSTVPKIKYTVKELLAIAEAELGYCNKKSNNNLYDKTANKGESPKTYDSGDHFPGRYTKYAKELHDAGYYGGNNKQGYHWCDMFVDWCFFKLVKNKTGKSDSECRKIAEELICQQKTIYGAGCDGSLGGYSNFKRFGKYPTPGAQIFYDRIGASGHTGIVVACDDTNVYTIEGNVSQQVGRCVMPRNGSKRKICGYGYPLLNDIKFPEEYNASGSIPPQYEFIHVPTTEAPEPDPTPDDATDILTGVTQPATTPLVMKYTDENPPAVCMQTTSRNYVHHQEMDRILGVLWHDTAAGNPMIKRYVQPSDDDPKRDEWLAVLGKNKYGNDWNHSDRQAGMNCWIGKLADGTVTTVQTMPWNYKPWGCGEKGLKYSCNEAWIQFEICDDFYKSEEYFNQVYEEAVQVTAYLCKKFDIDPLGTVEFHGKTIPTILDHRTSYKLGVGGNHGDVRNWLSKYGKYAEGNDGMQIVRQDVANLLASAAVPITKNIVKVGDSVKVNNGAVSRDGQTAKEYILHKTWNVTSCVGDYAKLGACIDNTNLVLNKEYSTADLTVVEATGTVPTTPNIGTQTNEERVWNLLLKEIKNPVGVGALMGNLYCESGFKPNNLEDSYAAKTGFTDESYTAAVDNGTYSNFVNDAYGYGLAQWTWHTRKENLLNYARQKGVSIGDMTMQCEFLCKELRDSFSSLWDGLLNATDLKTASNRVLHEFERPADRSEYIEDVRAGHGYKYYEMFRNRCSHMNTQLFDVFEVSCNGDGYTGDVVCSDCGQVVEYGSIVPARSHNYFQGICTMCGALQSAEYNDTEGSGSGLLGRAELQQILSLLKSMLDR